MRYPSIVERLRGALREDPDALREHAIDVLRELTESAAGAWYALGLVDGEPLPTRWIVRGVPSAFVQRRAEERIPCPGGDPRVPDPRWNRRFVLLRSLLRATPRGASRLHRRCYEPHGIHDELRLVVHERDRVVASVGVLRGPGEPPFERAHVRRVAPLAEAISDALVAAESVERARLPVEGGELVLRADGAVELASDGARRMLALPRFAEQLHAWARRADAHGPPALLHGHRVRATRLSGAGRVRYLLRLEPIPPLRLHPTYVLSQAQREIAQLAAAGATAPEIAQMKAIALPTVRAHLRQVYERLEVTSRAELARTVDGITKVLERAV